MHETWSISGENRGGWEPRRRPGLSLTGGLVTAFRRPWDSKRRASAKSKQSGIVDRAVRPRTSKAAVERESDPRTIHRRCPEGPSTQRSCSDSRRPGWPTRISPSIRISPAPTGRGAPAGVPFVARRPRSASWIEFSPRGPVDGISRADMQLDANNAQGADPRILRWARGSSWPTAPTRSSPLDDFSHMDAGPFRGPQRIPSALRDLPRRQPAGSPSEAKRLMNSADVSWFARLWS